MREFKPAGYDGKPRHLPKDQKRLLRAALDAVEERIGAMTDDEQQTLLAGCLNVSPINCGWDEYAMAAIIHPSLSFDLEASEPPETAQAETPTP